MIVFIAIHMLAFHTSSSFYFVTDKTFFFESLLVNIFDSFYIDDAIFFLEVTFGNPNCTGIMYPYIMANWSVLWVSLFCEVVVIRFRLSI